MKSEDPNLPAPVGFFPEGPITDYADFLIINSPQEIYDLKSEDLKKKFQALFFKFKSFFNCIIS